MGLFVFIAFLYSLGIVYSFGAGLFSPLLIDFLFYVSKKKNESKKCYQYGSLSVNLIKARRKALIMIWVGVYNTGRLREML